jgi:hypothetical protein
MSKSDIPLFRAGVVRWRAEELTPADVQALCEAVENNRTVTILNLSSTESAESSLNEWSCRYEAISMDS